MVASRNTRYRTRSFNLAVASGWQMWYFDSRQYLKQSTAIRFSPTDAPLPPRPQHRTK
jgi:hypothetical protein